MLHIDIETYSSVDIMRAGSYKYFESIDFEILLIAYAFDNNPIQIVDMACGELIPLELLTALKDNSIKKAAHNANFERNAFKKIGIETPIEAWVCTAIKAAYCGLPISLGAASTVLNLGDKAKLTAGKALIRLFCQPIKPTKTNGLRHRNLPSHMPDKWEDFRRYCAMDVEAERAIHAILTPYDMPQFEKELYILDQKINDYGIGLDTDLARKAYDIDKINSKHLATCIKKITNIENPNSAAQLKSWLGAAMNKDIKSLAKDVLPTLLSEASAAPVIEVLKLRTRASKTSIKKYVAMLNCVCADNRIRGLFQFYGANRTGRWAGRLVQLQNLPQNKIRDIESARAILKTGEHELFTDLYPKASDTLSQLIRTAFIAGKNKTFLVADFSAIEARVIAWLANEKWRMAVFTSHGKIYEASAAMMFGVPIESIDKGSDLRTKGKVAELALGYGGAIGALKKMGGEKMGLSENEMADIVAKWRNANKEVVKLWKSCENAAIQATRTKHKTIELPGFRNLVFLHDGKVLTIQLPSGRKLFYQNARLAINRFGKPSVEYKGLDQVTKKWWWVDSYGGKFVENIVQAIARDLLGHSMVAIDKAGFKICMHVHDEIICEHPNDMADEKLQEMCRIMSTTVPWATELPLTADGYITPFYKKD